MSLTIDRLAHQGDGVAKNGDTEIFVAHTLPGETVEADVVGNRGRLVDITRASSLRVEPPCRHFALCGGCSLQHLSQDAYLAFKMDQVRAAFKARDLDIEPEPIIAVAPATRRRATFVAVRNKGSAILGFHEARSDRIIDLSSCVVLHPTLFQAVGTLKALSAIAAPSRGSLRLTVTLTDNGLDVRLDDADPSLDLKREQDLITLAIQAEIARLSIADDVIMVAREPYVMFGKAKVTIPPGGFLQATKPSEDAMSKLVVSALSGADHIADLFAGSGTFSLQLAKNARVHAVEGDQAALSALEKTARATPSLKPVTTERRDLFTRPLSAKDLSRFDAVLLDPPRAGARAQAQELAQSNMPRVVYVSCAPATAARDMRQLADFGFRLSSVTQVDQFLYSHHIELVCILDRG
ncbi:MAG: class I SAM-dependent RNA methyltransferase [Pseudomonadota bacterium]